MRDVTTIGLRTVLIGDEQRLEIHIKAPRNWLALIFTTLWLAGWTIGGLVSLWALLSDTSHAPILLHILWQCGWLAGKLFVLYIFLWYLCGQEIITITPKTFIRKLDIFGRGIEQNMAAELQNLRASLPLAPRTQFERNEAEHYGLSGGTIVADVLGEPFRFDIRLDEDEAQAIIEAMRPYL